MNLSVSNIGWRPEDTESVIPILRKYGISNIDVTPTLFDKDIEKIDTDHIVKYYNKAGIRMVGMQSLLFSCPPVSLFDGEKEKEIILNHLRKIFKLASDLKIKNLVFGSPKNRFIRNVNHFTMEDAIRIFKEIGDTAQLYDCIVCLEANAREYGCNFITNTFDAIDFIRKVDHKNLKMILDISTTLLNDESLESIFMESQDLIEHIHISSPFLKSISSLRNEDISSTFKKFNYNKFIALECSFQNCSDLTELEDNIALFKNVYN
jgi:sugar phosphate isomerase/epimerase